MASVPVGTKFGRLTVVGDGERVVNKGNGYLSTSMVLCDCGTSKTVRNTSLRNGRTVSCGCLQREKASALSSSRATHGKSSSRAFHSWCAMRQRCYYAPHKDFNSYGGRGIIVCDRWKDSFQNFYDDMGDPPKGLSLDRIDTNGNYSKENCRWADSRTQALTKRRSHKVVLNGQLMTMSEAARSMGRDPSVPWGIAKREGLTIQQAIDKIASGDVRSGPPKKKRS